MVTALVAYEKLSPTTRHQLVGILKDHPRFKEDFKSVMPDGLTADDEGRFLFCQASVWPDLVRRQSDGNVPPNPDKKTSYHRKHWHFINFPFALVPDTAPASERKELEKKAKQNLNLDTTAPLEEKLKMNVLQAIEFNAGVLKDKSNPRPDRAVAICWLLHLVGDIHQPLHASALFTENMFEPSSNAEGDRGGNRIKFGPSKNDNLHSLWDDAPGRKHTFQFVLSRAEALVDDLALASQGEAAALVIDPIDWAKESFALAKEQVYTVPLRKQILIADKNGNDPDEEEIIDLPLNYWDDAAKLSARRVVEGGHRLAAKLKASTPQ